MKLAHVMEDCLVAVQQGSLSMTASGIDLLLAGTDWLGQFGESAGQDFATWYASHDAAVTQLISQLEAFLRGEATAPVSIQPLSSSSETHNVELQAESSGSAESIAAGSALSGSALTESASLQPRIVSPLSNGVSRKPKRSTQARWCCFTMRCARAKRCWPQPWRHGKRH